MATPQNSAIVPGNGSQTASTKKKGTRKASSAKNAEAAPKAAAPSRISIPVEILFTQEPNPYRQPEAPYIWIDFPAQSESLGATEYVIRLGVGGADLVEISIDKSAWLPCRLTSGYWWYDWSNISKGRHTLVARMRTPDGRWFKTPLRQCEFPAE